jgi:hypothetical protein
VTSISDWTQFFVAVLGAAAALAGLVFVGLALNMTRILSLPTLPNRAIQAISVLAGIVFAAALVLVPGQTAEELGLEIIAFGIVLWAILTRLSVQNFRTAKPEIRHFVVDETIWGQVCAGFFILGGIALVLWGPVGLYLVVPGVLLSFANGILDAWVLLVEINR